MKRKMTLRGPGIKVECDADQIFPSDSGQGTPVLVVLDNGETATWNCALSEGETVDGTKFTEEQFLWFNSGIIKKVDAWCLQYGA